MIDRLLLFGASGDLAARYLLPALATMSAAGRLPDGFRLVGAAPEEWDDDGFRRHADANLRRHADGVPAAARDALLRSLAYRRVDLNDAGAVGDAVEAAAGPGRAPLTAYLALPPALFAPAIEALAQAGLPDGSRIAVEKPFGDDVRSAAALNALLARACGAGAEERIFRVDHVLGLPAVQNLLALRLRNRVLDAVWTSAHVESIEVVWDETLALEGRAGYYDRAGALKDMIQNHLLQILALAVMEPPPGDGERELHDAKVDVLHALRADPRRSRRGRYTAGRIGDRAVPAYSEEAGVDPSRCTETYAEVALTLDNRRWRGTGFLLRTGKALGEDRTEVVVRFRPAEGGADAGVSELRVGLDKPDTIELRLIGAASGSPRRPALLSLRAPTPSSELAAYGHVLVDVLSGGTRLSVRGDEAEAAWGVVAPVLEAWAGGRVPLEEYAAGSSGPGE